MSGEPSDRSSSSGRAIRRGTIPGDGVLGLLREIEALHVTGLLSFRAQDGSGTIALERGQIAAEQDDRTGDPVERFLALREGRFEVLQVLPSLHGTEGDAERRTGVIGEHAVADLMAYCERAGLTGVLQLEREGVRAEAVYDRGELTGLVVDGAPDEAVEDVFAWGDGLFSIEAHIETPELPALTVPPPPKTEIKDLNDTIPAPPPVVRQDTTQTRLLRVVEMSLADVLRKREERRPSVRPEGVGPSPEEVRKDATVRVVFLGASGEAIVGRSTADSLPDEAEPERVSKSRVSGEARRPAPPSGETGLGLPRFAIAALLVLLLAGLAAFVVTLLRVG